MGYLKYVKALYKNKKSLKEGLGDAYMERKKALRREDPVVRLEHPTRPDRARAYGYRSKQGFVIARAHVRAGSARTSRPSRGRKPLRMGIKKLTMAKSIQRIAEERVSKKFPNLQVLASYWVMDDGKKHWYEVILVDPSHPAIKKDAKMGWISKVVPDRAGRGKTPAGKKGRGQGKKGTGREKMRPSLRAKGRTGK